MSISNIPKIPNAMNFGEFTKEQTETVIKRVENELAATGGTEITFDHVLNINVRREYIAQKSTLMLLGGDVILQKPETGLENTIVSGDSLIEVTGPIQPESDSEVSRTHTITFPSLNYQLSRYEVRHSVADSAKLRGDWEFTVNESFKAATASMVAKKENRILQSFDGYIPTVAGNGISASHSIAAAKKWNADNASPEEIANEITKSLANILVDSDITTEEIQKPGAYTLVLPISLYEFMNKKKVVGSVLTSVEELLGGIEGIQIRYSRAPRYFQDTWAVQSDAYLIPTKNSSIGYLATWDGGTVYPSSVQERTTRGTDYITREWFEWYAFPQPWYQGASTNALLGKITGVAS